MHRFHCYCLVAVVGIPTAPAIDFVRLNVPSRTYIIRIQSAILHHVKYTVIKMELHARDNKQVSLQLSLSEHSLATDIDIGGTTLLALDGKNTTGELEVPVSSLNSSMDYYLIVTYELTDKTSVAQPIGWMRAGDFTSFSFRSLLVGMRKVRDILNTYSKPGRCCHQFYFAEFFGELGCKLNFRYKF